MDLIAELSKKDMLFDITLEKEKVIVQKQEEEKWTAIVEEKDIQIE